MYGADATRGDAKAETDGWRCTCAMQACKRREFETDLSELSIWLREQLVPFTVLFGLAFHMSSSSDEVEM
ncbi:unnamed protein product [Angiostrongylus costaricensis]|uniref:Uncharacterized protein n=1 Tax=Angiostrongylus costaricensis TaxID=334426 RepID=A0A0R3PM21_ANGCS|nr:unnamed protein product [Angiostrongylus costaricensis]